MTDSIGKPPFPGTEDAAGTARLQSGTCGSKKEDKAAVRKVAREFEALFASMMLKSMRATVGKDSLTGGGHGEEVYRSLLDQEYANAMTQGGGLGLARLIEQQLERQFGCDETNDTRTKP